MSTKHPSSRGNNVKKLSGFTLVELLLVMTLAPIVFVAVYSNFSAGTRIWQRLQADTPEEDTAIFLSKAKRDFTEAMRFSPIPFSGDDEEVAFAAGIDTVPALGGHRGIGRIRYFYDPKARGIMREIRNFSHVYEDKPGSVTRLLGDIDSFKLSYLAYDPLAPGYVWTEGFEPKPNASPLPAAVRMSYTTASGEAVERTLFVSSGGGTK